MPGPAQVDNGSLCGMVTDQSGAAIPEAVVVILQEQTGFEVRLITGTSGFYSAPALRPGYYIVSAAKQGFQSARRGPIELRVQERLAIDFQLQLGPMRGEIVVMGGAPLLETETSSLGQIIETKTITELPLNGRNFVLLATLGPGILPSLRTNEQNTFVSNGARPVQNGYLLDGVDNRNRIIGFDNSSAQIVQPVLDAIQEFKVQTSAFSAEFGESAGGVMNVMTKSGGNELHGAVFEFVRNSAFDAAPFFQPDLTSKPSFILNQFGATAGGPLRRNRTFFFGAWESARVISAGPKIGTVPLASMRGGEFGDTLIFDPATTRANPAGSGFVRDAFPGNRIPRSRWDAVAAKLAPLYPLPSRDGAVGNFLYNPKERRSSDKLMARLDHQGSDANHLFGRFAADRGAASLAPLLPAPANDLLLVNLGARAATLGDTYIISGHSLNEFRFAYIYTRHDQDTPPPRRFEEFDILGVPNVASIRGLPNFIIGGLSNLGTAPPGGAASAISAPTAKSGTIYQFLDSFSWVRGRHTWKFGGQAGQTTMHVHAANGARPDISFTGVYTQRAPLRADTGSGFADFLLGSAAGAYISTQNLNELRQRVFAAYLQDDWKVSARLTFNLGLRYELQTPFIETADRQANLVLEQGVCHLQLVTVREAGRCGLGRALVQADANNFAPRAGVAWRPGAHAVVRAGFGAFYGRDENVGIQRRLPNNPPYAVQTTISGDRVAPSLVLARGFPAGVLDPATAVNPNVVAFPAAFPLPYVLQWNVNVERELRGNLLAQVGYSGAGAHKLYYVNNVNQPSPGAGLIDTRRPIPGYGAVSLYAPLINSSYSALLAKVERRFSRGLNLLAAYTWGHSLDSGKNINDFGDPIAQDARNLRAEHASSNFDVRHRLVISGICELPKSAGRLARAWQVSGILAAQTGLPFTPVLGFDPTNTGTVARPDRLADGALPSAERTPARWFDTSAFRIPPQLYVYGNSGRGILTGAGLFTVDLSMARTVALGGRVRAQLRAEAFNLFNRCNLGLPNAVIGDPRAGSISNVTTPERQLQFAIKLLF